MKKPKYPMTTSDIKEVSGAEEANRLAAQGYCLLGVRVNRFLVDDNEFSNEFIYSMGKKKED